MKPIRSFLVSVTGHENENPWQCNARTAGQAKMEFIRMLDGCIEIDWSRLRARVASAKPESSEQFIRNAEYRGFPAVRCGARVKVGQELGTVVGHNSSANFVVLFDPDSVKYLNLRLSVHPDELELIAETK